MTDLSENHSAIVHGILNRLREVVVESAHGMYRCDDWPEDIYRNTDTDEQLDLSESTTIEYAAKMCHKLIDLIEPTIWAE